MMKYVFLLTLLIVGACGLVFVGNIVFRWTHNMTETSRVMPGERVFAMVPGSVPRSGGELYYTKEERDVAATRKNPIPSTPESVRRGGELFAIYCTPCHGASGKGDGLVATKFVPPADLTNADLQKARTDGFWQHYLTAGGVLMPAYGEALSSGERWQVVNYVRTLAKP